VSQVASDVQAVAMSRAYSIARQTAPSDQGSATPFASLLDDSVQSTADTPPPPPPSSSDPVSRANQSDNDAPPQPDDAATAANSPNPAPAQPPATKPINPKTADAPISGGDAVQPDATIATDGGKIGKLVKTAKSTANSKAVSDDKVAADAKIAAPNAGTGEANTASDTKPADGQAPPAAVPVAAAVAIPGLAPIATAAPAEAATATSDTGAEALSAAAAAAIAGTAAATSAAAKAKVATPAATPTIAGKPATASKTATQTAPQAPIETDPKTQVSATADAGKDDTTQTHGEASGASTHHAATADTPLAPTAGADTAAPNAADALQTPTPNPPAQNTLPPAASIVPAAPQTMAQTAAIPLSGVAVAIASKAADGNNHFDIRLDPPELGRVEVRLNVDKDGNVTTHMIADRSDTLDLLRRDSSGLERALQDAGLKTADNSLQFSLRDHSTQQQQDNSGARTTQVIAEDNTLPVISAAQRGYNRLAGQGSGIDIHV
jgi:flagellar hook-length control protein FliK